MANGLRAARAARGGGAARDETPAARVARVRREAASQNRSDAAGGGTRHPTRGRPGGSVSGRVHQQAVAARATATSDTPRAAETDRRQTLKDRFQRAVTAGPNPALRRELFEHRAKKALSDHAQKAQTEFRSAFAAHTESPTLTRGTEAETRAAYTQLTRTFYDDAKASKPRSYFDPHRGTTRDTGGTDFIGSLNLETGNVHTGNIHVETPGNKKVLSGTDVINARASAERTLAKQRAEGTEETLPSEFAAPDVRSVSVSSVINANTKPVMELATAGTPITDPKSDLLKGATRVPAETEHYKRALRALGGVDPKEVFARHTEIGGMMRKTVGNNAEFSATNLMGENSRTFTGTGTVYRAKRR